MSRPQITDAHQLGISAVVLDDPDRPWQRTGKRCDGLRSNHRMGAIRDQDGDRIVIDPGTVEAIDYDRKHLWEACLPRSVRHDNSYRIASTGDIDQGRTGERLIDGCGGLGARIPTGRGARRQCTDPKAAEVESEFVGGKREFDNHGVTIPSW